MKKYELTNETTTAGNGQVLYRIKALVDIGDDVKAGDLGGYVAGEGNLSHEGNAWVYGDASVYGNARVYDNAMVYGDAMVSQTDDYLYVAPIGSRNASITFCRTKTGISVHCGCFDGTLEEFDARVKETHGDNEYGQVYRHLIEIAKLRIKVRKEENNE